MELKTSVSLAWVRIKNPVMVASGNIWFRRKNTANL